MTFVLALFCFF
jgi:tRNA(Ile)-lysidine synthase